MAKILYLETYPWLFAKYTECGPFTAGVHIVDEDTLYEEAANHLKEVHGQK